MNEPIESAELFRRDLEDRHVSKLLKLGLSDGDRRVDSLLTRLEGADADWLGRLLEDHFPADSSEDAGRDASVEGRMLDPKTAVESLREIKERSKVVYRGGSEEQKLAGLAGYFLSVAAALAHHGELICGRDRDEVNPVLEDLADVLDTAWRELLRKAIATTG